MKGGEREMKRKVLNKLISIRNVLERAEAKIEHLRSEVDDRRVRGYLVDANDRVTKARATIVTLITEGKEVK